MDFRGWFLEMSFKSSGALRYGPGIRAIVEVDQGIANYYRSLIPKYHYVQPQMYAAHITIVRTGKETPKNMASWGKYEGEEIPFVYENQIHTDGNYWYLNVQSDRIGDIREELGLPRFRFGDRNYYHITIGNVKDAHRKSGEVSLQSD